MNNKVFKNKVELISWIKDQLNVELLNDKTNILNKKRNFLYTLISKENKLKVLSLLKNNNVYYEEHLNDHYFISVK